MHSIPGRTALALSCLLLASPVLAAPAADLLPALLAQGISGLSFSPDGSKVLVSMSAPGGIYNAYAVPAAGGAPVQLTRSDRFPAYAESYFPKDGPKDGRILFRGRKAEGEPERLFVREPDGKETDLTPGKPSRFKGWSPDGATFLVEEDQRGSGAHNLLEVSVQPGYARKILYQNIGPTSFAFASPDRRFLVFTQAVFDLSREVHLYEMKTARFRYLRSGEGEIVHLPVSFTPDGRSFLFLTDAGSEFLYLARLDIDSGVRTDVLKKSWDILGASYSPDGKLLAVKVGDDSGSHAELYEAATMRPLDLPGQPEGGDVAALAFSPDSKTLAVLSSGPAAPPQVRAWDVAKGGAPRELIQGGRPALPALVPAQVVRFPSFDGKQVPALLYRPAGASPEGKVPTTPAVIWVHDGPSGQARLAFEPLFQYLASRGWAVLAVNHRGSTGYGKTFQRLDDTRHGDVDLADCAAAKGWLQASGWADPGRIAIAGEGHGGFLAAAGLALRPQEFAGGVDLFGVLDWGRQFSMLRRADTARLSLSEEMGDVTNPEPFKRISPAYHADAVVRPLLVVQGADDTVVLPSEAQALVAAVKAKGVPAEEVVLPAEGHGLTLAASRDAAYRAVADFLDREVKPAAPPAAKRK